MPPRATSRRHAHSIHPWFACALLALVLASSGCAILGNGEATPTPDTGGEKIGSGRSVVAGAPSGPNIAIWLTSYGVMPWKTSIPSGGPVTFTIANHGEELHDFAIVRFDGDARALPTDGGRLALGQLQIVARSEPYPPGREWDVSTNLEPGRYVIVSTRSQDYSAGMGASFTVGITNNAPTPTPPTDNAVGAYVVEHGVMLTTTRVKAGTVAIDIQNMGREAHDLAVVRWRGGVDTLPEAAGRVMLDGLIEVHRVGMLPSGGRARVTVEAPAGYSYVVLATGTDEYGQGMRAAFRAE